MADLPNRWSPTVRRRRLATVLSTLRSDDGRTAADIAAHLGVSESTVIRLENPKHLKLPKPDLIARLLDIYDASAETRDQVAVLVEEARQRDWWHPYKAQLSAGLVTYLGLEAESAVLRVFHPTLIPDVLQTVDYAQLLLEEQTDLTDPAAFAAQRQDWQQRLLTGPEPIVLWVVIGEAALRQTVGGPMVMADQLDHLHEIAQMPHVMPMIVPFDASAHEGTAPFTLLTFPGPADPEAAYLPNPLGGAWVHDRASVDDLRRVFERLTLLSPLRDRTLKMIREAADGFRRGN